MNSMNGLNGMTTTEIWDAKMLTKLLLADGNIKDILDKKSEDKTYTNIRCQLENILSKLLIKKSNNLIFSKKTIITLLQTS